MQLIHPHRAAAHETGSGFFDTAAVARTSAIDGVHLDAENTRRIGAALAGFIGTL